VLDDLVVGHRQFHADVQMPIRYRLVIEQPEDDALAVAGALNLHPHPFTFRRSMRLELNFDAVHFLTASMAFSSKPRPRLRTTRMSRAVPVASTNGLEHHGAGILCLAGFFAILEIDFIERHWSRNVAAHDEHAVRRLGQAESHCITRDK
jgi:hypothetical protein